MKTEVENAKWIIEGIRESLEMIKAVTEETEWDKVAQPDEAWE